MARYNLRPRPKPSNPPFPFLALPAELRFQIYNYLLLSEPNCSHTHVDMLRPPLRQPAPVPLRRHGMLLANRQLHAEYAQAFYERTNFFFYVGTNTDNGEQSITVPLRTLPPALLPNLRQCKLYVELGAVVWMLDFLMEGWVAWIEALLGHMERVRWVHLVWDLRVMVGGPIWVWREEERLKKKELRERLWEWLGKRFVQRLKGKAGMQGMIVTVAGRVLKLERKGAEWVERAVVPY